MKIIFRNILIILLPILVFSNIYVFVYGFSLGEQANHYEADTRIIHQENIELEKRLFEVESLRYTASKAAELGFYVKPTPFIIDNFKYALNR